MIRFVSLLLLPVLVFGANGQESSTDRDELLAALRTLNYAREGGGLHNRLRLEFQPEGLTSEWQDALLAVATDPEATLEGRQLACHLLALGADGGVAAGLGPLLADPRLADDARLVLERMADSRADDVLLAALATTQGARQRGLIDTLARRGTVRAAPALIIIATQAADPATVTDALSALGQIGGDEAARFLVHRDWPSHPMLQAARAHGLVQLLAHHADALPAEEAQAAIARLVAPAMPIHLRASGLLAALRRDPTDLDTLLPLFASPDASSQQLAATLLPELSDDPAVIARLLDALPALAPSAQALVIRGLTHRGDAAIVEFARGVLAGEAEGDLPLAALRALEAFGEASDFEALMELVDAEDPLGAAARDALSRLPDPAMDARLMQAFADPDGDHRDDIVELIARRGMRDEVGALMAAAATAEPAFAADIYRAIGELGAMPEVEVLLGRLESLERRSRLAAERAIVAIGRRLQEDTVSTFLSSHWNSADEEMRTSLVRMVGSISDSAALAFLLPMVQRADPDPLAIRYLSTWSDPNVIPTLEALISRPEWPERARERIWVGMRRLANLAREEWHPDRSDFWDATLESAPRREDRAAFIASSLEFKNNDMLDWLTRHLERSPEDEALVRAHALLRQALGED